MTENYNQKHRSADIEYPAAPGQHDAQMLFIFARDHKKRKKEDCHDDESSQVGNKGIDEVSFNLEAEA
jgi:hypothetical protein